MAHIRKHWRFFGFMYGIALLIAIPFTIWHGDYWYIAPIAAFVWVAAATLASRMID